MTAPTAASTDRLLALASRVLRFPVSRARVIGRIVLGFLVDEHRVRIDRPPFLDARDRHRPSGRDLWTLSVVHDSARFGFASPAGLLRGPAPSKEKRGHPGLAGHDLVREGPCGSPAPCPSSPRTHTRPGRSPTRRSPRSTRPSPPARRAGSWRLRELARTLRGRERCSDAPEPAFVHLAMCGRDEWRPALGRVLDPGWRPAIERGLEPEGCNR